MRRTLTLTLLILALIAPCTLGADFPTHVREQVLVLTPADASCSADGWHAYLIPAPPGGPWTEGSGLQIGRDGTGTLTVSDGGEARVNGEGAGLVIGARVGGDGTVTVTGPGPTPDQLLRRSMLA